MRASLSAARRRIGLGRTWLRSWLSWSEGEYPFVLHEHRLHVGGHVLLQIGDGLGADGLAYLADAILFLVANPDELDHTLLNVRRRVAIGERDRSACIGG